MQVIFLLNFDLVSYFDFFDSISGKLVSFTSPGLKSIDSLRFVVSFFSKKPDEI
jgi:hypothetical protein